MLLFCSKVGVFSHSTFRAFQTFSAFFGHWDRCRWPPTVHKTPFSPDTAGKLHAHVHAGGPPQYLHPQGRALVTRCQSTRWCSRSCSIPATSLCLLLSWKFTVSELFCHKNELNLYPLVQTTIDRVVTWWKTNRHPVPFGDSRGPERWCRRRRAGS